MVRSNRQLGMNDVEGDGEEGIFLNVSPLGQQVLERLGSWAKAEVRRAIQEKESGNRRVKLPPLDEVPDRFMGAVRGCAFGLLRTFFQQNNLLPPEIDDTDDDGAVDIGSEKLTGKPHDTPWPNSLGTAPGTA